jgi:predicted metal-dependent phosphotriesterase family hydrolase
LPDRAEAIVDLHFWWRRGRGDLKLLDVETVISEATLYKQHGGRSLVDATSIGIARDPERLLEKRCPCPEPG